MVLIVSQQLQNTNYLNRAFYLLEIMLFLNNVAPPCGLLIYCTAQVDKDDL